MIKERDEQKTLLRMKEWELHVLMFVQGEILIGQGAFKAQQEITYRKPFLDLESRSHESLNPRGGFVPDARHFLTILNYAVFILQMQSGPTTHFFTLIPLQK